MADERREAVVRVVLDDERAAGLDVGHERRVRRAERRARVERAHAGDDGVEARQRRGRERLLVEERDVVADAAQARGHLVARAREVADRLAAGRERDGHEAHVRVGEPRLHGDVRVVDVDDAA